MQFKFDLDIDLHLQRHFGNSLGNQSIGCNQNTHCLPNDATKLGLVTTAVLTDIIFCITKYEIDNMLVTNKDVI